LCRRFDLDKTMLFFFSFFLCRFFLSRVPYVCLRAADEDGRDRRAPRRRFETGDEVDIAASAFELDAASALGRILVPAMRRIVIKLGRACVTAIDGECGRTCSNRSRGDGAPAAMTATKWFSSPSGAIARGMRVMDLRVRPRAIEELQRPRQLYPGYTTGLRDHGVAPRRCPHLLRRSARGTYLNARRTLRKLPDWGVVPVINENDTTATDEITFGDKTCCRAGVDPHRGGPAGAAHRHRWLHTADRG